MGLSLTPVGKRHVAGDLRLHVFDVTFDSSFADEGESLTASMCGLSNIAFVTCAAAYDPGYDLAYLPVYSHVSSKLMVFNSAGDGDAFDKAGADDLSTYLCRIMVWGN
jgi:hypothetical protein